MILHIATLLLFQMIGEAMMRITGASVPGPVIGMALFLVFMILRPAAADAIRPTVQGLLSHLSLLFVPAGVGVVGHLGLLADEGIIILVTLIISTVAAIAVAALVFVAVARWTGVEDAQ